MEKKTVLAIFLTLAVGLLVMGVVEVVAGSIGGTPLVIACYVVIAVILAVILMKTSKKEKENGDGAGSETAEDAAPMKRDGNREQIGRAADVEASEHRDEREEK